MVGSESNRTLRIATRGSSLALWQAGWVRDRLVQAHRGLTVELVEIATRGDRDQSTPLAAIGGQGLFTKEIQRAVLDGRADVAVHSLKDLPTAGPGGLILAAIPAREKADDVLIAPRYGSLDALPPRARVGTGSLRRRSQLLWLRPDLEIVGIRGNVETRLKTALEGRLDAVVLAEAGLLRLGLQGHVTERLTPPRFLPAVGQGALGVECRREDAATRRLLASLDDAGTRSAVVAERTVMAELEAGCMIPLACWGRVERDGQLHLDAAVLDPAGTQRVHAAMTGPPEAPERLGRAVAESLRSQGAENLLRRAGTEQPGH
jgi:hydroxymethylbilane synthase